MPHDDLQKLLELAPICMGELNRAAAAAPPAAGTPSRWEADAGIEITEEYQLVRRLLQKNFPVVFVSGKAGTGKSTLISWLRHVFPGNLAIVAPTGVAALNVGGVTIHSFFQFPPHLIRPKDVKELANRRLYKKLDLLIVDEVSMVRPDIMDGMDLFLRKNGRDPNLPFGGAKLLLVGDLFQLPPVVERQEDELLTAMNYATPYFFSAHVLQECPVAPVELSRIWRQSDPAFAEMLNAVREARDLDGVLSRLNERVEPVAPSRSPKEVDAIPEGVVTLTATNALAEAINQAKLQKLPGETVLLRGTLSGRFPVEEARLPSPMELALKPGAQVMFTKNDDQKSKRWVNGSLGVVRSFGKAGEVRVEMISDQPGRIHDVSKTKWVSYRYEFRPDTGRIEPVEAGKYEQFPLMLAWAITIHKSQGKTLDRVRIDLGHGAFAPGQVYVALSRCRRLENLQLASSIQPADIRCDARIVRFYEKLAEIQRRFAGGEPARDVTLPAVNLACPRCGAALRQLDDAGGGRLECSSFPDCDYIRRL